jgi:hypothetical protein
MPTTTTNTTPTKKPTTRTSRKKVSPTKKTSTRKKTVKKDIVTTMNKEQLVSWLQRTMKDMGKIPWMFLAPVIAYVSTKYESIPAARRKKLEEIVKSGKEQWWSIFTKLKDRFIDRFHDAKQTVTSDTDKKPVKKRAPRKKTVAATKKKTTSTRTKKTTATNAKTTPSKKTTTPRKTTRKPATKKASE